MCFFTFLLYTVDRPAVINKHFLFSVSITSVTKFWRKEVEMEIKKMYYKAYYTT